MVSDPKAELFDYTSVFLKKLGYEVICLDFKNPEKSTRYNLLQPVIDAVKEKDMERAEMYAWDTVSYTHLDVYKRQACTLVKQQLALLIFD